MDVHATLRYLRMAPRKVRLVVDSIRGLPVNEALTRLSFLKKDAARPVMKLLQSAIANAENNFKLAKSDLVVKKITADGGPTLSRFRPRAMGRAAPIRKRTTHINIVLSDEKASPKSIKSIKSVKSVKSKAKEKKAKVLPNA
ncbi:50S ribosomal protein L22 [Patescibacteria group bacterium]|nr:50S ribosomal protein L22 [Patescibacteria group bacterium]MBU1034496.1 50S ribosomal protein L22 [Patescibacteria group bacterium]MBU1629827.1 50S ribosomal protein L22 [Patescibacteria group bacterium]MBU1908026.1 50S ribosomal protein L22 [Patescibacteria group bacterium]